MTGFPGRLTGSPARGAAERRVILINHNSPKLQETPLLKDI